MIAVGATLLSRRSPLRERTQPPAGYLRAAGPLSARTGADVRPRGRGAPTISWFVSVHAGVCDLEVFPLQPWDHPYGSSRARTGTLRVDAKKRWPLEADRAALLDPVEVTLEVISPQPLWELARIRP